MFIFLEIFEMNVFKRWCFFLSKITRSKILLWKNLRLFICFEIWNAPTFATLKRITYWNGIIIFFYFKRTLLLWNLYHFLIKWITPLRYWVCFILYSRFCTLISLNTRALSYIFNLRKVLRIISLIILLIGVSYSRNCIPFYKWWRSLHDIWGREFSFLYICFLYHSVIILCIWKYSPAIFLILI